MYFKIILFAGVVALAAAQHGHGQGHEYGHAISSQSVVLHATHEHQQAPAHHQLHHDQQQEQYGHHLVQYGDHQLQHGQHQLHHGHHQQHHDQHQHHQDHHVDYYAHPKYEFEYKVEDPHTGDKKFQHESRDGDVVKGIYSLHESDGTIRVVKYAADKHSGFHAQVHHEGHSQHVVPEYHNHH